MKNFFKENKTAILIGIVSSLIVTVLIKLLGIAATIMPSAGESIISSVVNSIYRMAADQSSVAISGNVFLIVISSLLGISISTFTLPFIYYLIKRNAVNSDKNKENSQMQTEITAKKGKSVKNHKTKKMISYSISGTFFSIIIFCICFFYIYYPTKLWHSFQIDFTQISPYISDAEEEKVLSQWTLMKSKEDYFVIEEYIREVKEENSLNQQ
ncbi:MAG: hypothetical protein E7424_01050 [Ruminococcaceae bacterium]|nr:hypothetical protein [Oscillospiraceae bacterium]